ncbi:DUF2197 domain-containing protein [Paenibacillus sp. NRS-1760]|uniref:DUF2197 domain-containing protein n=1 Tax=unclassified Paenibacillus TaxID=185978 RepID=UPI003D28EC0E
MHVNCMLCRKPFDINHSDPQYRKLIEKQTKYYICQSCHSKTTKEASAMSEIKPEGLDPKGYDKLIT